MNSRHTTPTSLDTLPIDKTYFSIAQDKESRVTALNGRYVPTAKNEPVRDFWERMGYAENGELWSRVAPFPERRSFVCRNS